MTTWQHQYQTIYYCRKSRNRSCRQVAVGKTADSMSVENKVFTVKKKPFQLAKKRLFALLSSKLITTTSNLLDEYNAIFKQWEKQGCIEQINNPYPIRQGMWYFPHFPIVKMNKETTKIRSEIRLIPH
jgi:protease II